MEPRHVPFSHQVIQTLKMNTIQVPAWKIQSNLFLVAANVTTQSAAERVITVYVPCYGSPAQEELNSFLIPSLKTTLNTSLKSNSYKRTETGSNSTSSKVYLKELFRYTLQQHLEN